MSEAILITYGVIKVLAYVLVCHLGLRWLAHRTSAWRAIALGLLRALMGLGFGVGIFLASATVVAAAPQGDATQALAYLLVYVPTRWVEWALIALFLVPGARSLRGFWLGANRTDRRWRLVGIAVSCTADLPVLIAFGGLPLGRCMC